MMPRARTWFAATALAIAGSVGVSHAGDIRFAVSFDDPSAKFTDYYADIERCDAGGGARLGAFHDGAGGCQEPSIEILVDFREVIGIAAAGSYALLPIRPSGELTLVQQSVPYEILTGEDITESDPDAILSLNAETLRNEMWFDPNPELRTAPIPRVIDRDFYSVVLHELAHVFGLLGNLNEDGTPFNEFILPYDEHVTVAENGRLFFNGPEAVRVYGGPVPLTPDHYFHVGTDTGAGSDLQQDLMHAFADCSIGGRCHISRLNLAMLRDVGMPVVVPPTEPSLRMERLADRKLRLSWPQAVGPVRLQSSDRLEPGEWIDVVGPLGGWTWELNRGGGEKSRFYRIVESE